MKDIAIYGAGGLGREVACLIKKLNSINPTWNIIGFFDDEKPAGSEVSHFGKVLGNIDTLNGWEAELAVVLCIGSPKTLMTVRNKIINNSVWFPNLIDPNFSVADMETFCIGEGNIIKADCTATTEVSIGSFNLLNTFIHIGHDACIGDFNVFMPGVRVSGEVKIGNCNLFGAGSFIKQQIRIGDGVTLSPLSALLTKPKDGNIYIGNPAKIFRI